MRKLIFTLVMCLGVLSGYGQDVSTSFASIDHAMMAAAEMDVPVSIMFDNSAKMSDPDPWQNEAGKYLEYGGSKLVLGFSLLLVGTAVSLGGTQISNNTIGNVIMATGGVIGVFGTVNLFQGAANIRKSGEIMSQK